MKAPRILVFAGSIREGSFNQRLANAAADRFASDGALVSRISLTDYSMPIYDGAIEAAGLPETVLALHAQFAAHDGIFMATPEYNSFPSPLLLNALDWLSRVRHYEGGMIEAFERPVFAIGAASPSPIGGYRALTNLRQKMALGLGATVVPAMVAVPAAYQAFTADGALAVDHDIASLDRMARQFLAAISSHR